MKELSLFFILVASVLSMINSSPLNFKGMIQRITGKNALIYFIGYGCYCGKEGKGKPRDATDMCCFHLDCCYESLSVHKCHPIIDHYSFLFDNNDVICENRGKPSCPQRVCECDREASHCFKREAYTYNHSLHEYPAILCKETTPKCPHGEEVVQEEHLDHGGNTSHKLKSSQEAKGNQGKENQGGKTSHKLESSKKAKGKQGKRESNV